MVAFGWINNVPGWIIHIIIYKLLQILPPPPLDNPARVINSSNATSVADASSLPFLLFLSSFLSFLCLLVALLILLLGIGFYRRRRRKQQGAGENETAASFNPMGEGGLKTMTENDLYESAQLLSADTLNLIGCKAVLDQERVVLERQIGAGNFGKVYKGEQAKGQCSIHCFFLKKLFVCPGHPMQN